MPDARAKPFYRAGENGFADPAKDLDDKARVESDDPVNTDEACGRKRASNEIGSRQGYRVLKLARDVT